MNQVTIKITETGICEIIREAEDNKKKETILRLDANCVAVHSGKEIQIYVANGIMHSVTMPDEVTAQLEYDRIADYIADAINNTAPRSRRSHIGLREVDMILMNEDCRPVPATDGSAGYDCKVDIEAIAGRPGFDAEKQTLTLGGDETFMVPLGFYIHIADDNYEAQLRPRSGKGSKGLVLGNLLGTIDSDYQGVVMACLWNRTGEPMEIDLTQPVCQLVFNRVEHPRFNMVSGFEATERGDGGFGSTDEKAVN